MDYRPCKNFREAFAAVHGGECALGVIPLENVLQGSVGQLDPPWNTRCTSRPSHFAPSSTRCCPWNRLRKRSKWCIPIRRRLPSASAGCVSTCPKPLWPAIPPPPPRAGRFPSRGAPPSGTRACPRCSVCPSRLHLRDEPTNQTRFVVIGPKPTDTSAANKTSVLFTLPDKPGSLAGILDLLFKAGVNLQSWSRAPCASELEIRLFRRSRDEPAQARALRRPRRTPQHLPLVQAGLGKGTAGSSEEE